MIFKPHLKESKLEETVDYARAHPFYLFIPTTYSDFAKVDDETGLRPAMHIFNTLEQLQTKHDSPIRYIHVGADQFDREQFDELKEALKPIPNASAGWNDDPDMQSELARLKKDGLPVIAGKGRNMWLSLMHRYMIDRNSSFIAHDADIRPRYKTNQKIYTEDYPLSLMTPMCHRDFGEMEFVKASYTRLVESNRGDFSLRGRVNRLLVKPFLKAVDEEYGGPEHKGVHEYIRFMQEFDYPLSGEFGMRARIANNLPIQPDFGLEIGMLSSLYEMNARIAQVDLGDFDHKHSGVSSLKDMSEQIVKTLYRTLFYFVEDKARDERTFESTMYDYRKFLDDQINNDRLMSRSQDWIYNIGEEFNTSKEFRDAAKDAFDQFKEDPENIKRLPAVSEVNYAHRKTLYEIIANQNDD